MKSFDAMEWNREFKRLIGLQCLLAFIPMLIARYAIKDEGLEIAVLSLAVGIMLAVVVQLVWCGVHSETKKKTKLK